MKTVTIIATCVAALTVSSAAFAGSYSGTSTAQASNKVLMVVPNLCPASITALKAWATKTNTIGSFAVPSALRGTEVSCDNPGPAVSAGISANAPSVQEAKAAALTACEAARTDANGPCVVLGTVTTR